MHINQLTADLCVFSFSHEIKIVIVAFVLIILCLI